MMKNLILEANLSNYDDVYEMIIDMHEGMTEEESQSTNSKLILILANHIGSSSVISQATKTARDSTLEWRSEGSEN